jgi:hypothetical protein
MATEEDTLLDLDDLEAMNLDGVDEAPEFMVPPSGKYRLGIGTADIQTREKEGETKQAMRIIYFVRETIEVANQEEDEVPVGTLFSENFQATSQGLEFFKARMKKLLGDDLTGVSIKDMLDFLPKQFGKDGDKDILSTQRKTTSGDFENVRFQKIEVVDRS